MQEDVSDGSGIVEFTKLPDGFYLIQETAAPRSHKPLDKLYMVELRPGKTDSFKVYAVEYKDGSYYTVS